MTVVTRIETQTGYVEIRRSADDAVQLTIGHKGNARRARTLEIDQSDLADVVEGLSEMLPVDDRIRAAGGALPLVGG